MTVALSGVVSFALLAAIRATIGLRVTREGESEGLDLIDHGENTYS